jgi:anti-anti-sigma regulatory factor
MPAEAPVIKAILFIIFFIFEPKGETNMTDSVEKTEHFAVIKCSSHKLEESEAKHLLKQVKAIFETEPYNYLLIDLEGVKDFEDDALAILTDAVLLAEAKTGLLIFFHGKEAWIDTFADAALTLVPTRHEAIEYVYMDQLEKKFLSDEE